MSDDYDLLRNVPDDLPDDYERVAEHCIRKLMRQDDFDDEGIHVDIFWRGQTLDEPKRGSLVLFLRKNREVVLCLDICLEHFRRLKDVDSRVRYKNQIKRKWRRNLNMARRRLLHTNERLRDKTGDEYSDQKVIDDIKQKCRGGYSGDLF